MGLGPQVPVPAADEGGQRGRVGQRVHEGLVTEVGAERVDAQTEGLR